MPDTQNTHIQTIGVAVTEVINLLQKLNAPLYIFAGFALYLYGLESTADDGDIRIFHPDIVQVAGFIEHELPDKQIELIGAQPYTGGLYLNDRLKITGEEVTVDVCNQMNVDCDLGMFSFPFDRQTFEDIHYIEHGGAELPVVSLEFVLLYYLVLRRGYKDGKQDEERIRRILASDKLDHDKFRAMIASLPQATQILSLYKSHMK